MSNFMSHFLRLIMGNCIVLSRPKRISSSRDATTGSEKILRIVKSDGKVLEYGTSILVKDLLMNFNGFEVGTSKGTSQPLPPNYELKIGQIYYLLPCFGSTISPPSPLTESHRSESVKQIKVVITKQQLQDLLSEKVSLDEMLLGVSKESFDDDFEPTRNWRPMLETIPEGRE